VARPKKEQRPVPHEEFVRSWEASSSVEEVASSLGMTVNAANQRARNYRRLGVSLKRMTSKPPIPVEALNRLIAEIRRPEGEDE
jgi:hypothetical protein